MKLDFDVAALAQVEQSGCGRPSGRAATYVPTWGRAALGGSKEDTSILLSSQLHPVELVTSPHSP